MADAPLVPPSGEAASAPEIETLLPIGLPVEYTFVAEPTSLPTSEGEGGPSEALASFLRPPELAGPAGLSFPGVFVRIAGRWLDLQPLPASLAELADVSYVFGGWTRVEHMLWQLEWIPRALDDPDASVKRLLLGVSRDAVIAMVGAKAAVPLLPPPSDGLPSIDPTAAHSFGADVRQPSHLWGATRPPAWSHVAPQLQPAGPEWAMNLVEVLAQLPPHASHVLLDPLQRKTLAERVRGVEKAYRGEMAGLRKRILAEMTRVEDVARELAVSKLNDARANMLSEGWRLLGEISGLTFEEWESGPNYTGRIRNAAGTEAFKDLFAILKGVSKLAEEAADAHFALVWEVLGEGVQAIPGAAEKGAKIPGVAAPAMTVLAWMEAFYLAKQSARVKALQQRHEEAQARLVAALSPAASRFPVLLRFSLRELADARHFPSGNVAEWVYLKLHDALVANRNMEELLSREQPLSKIDDTTLTGAPEYALAMHYKKSVWAYGKLMEQAAQAAYLVPGSLAAVAFENLMAAVAEKRAGDERIATVVSVAEVGLVLAAGLVCPPAGVALDLAFGVADATSEIALYRTQSDEYYCALDPADAFAELEPSALPVVLAVGGLLMTGI